MERNNASDITGRYFLWMGDAKGEKLRGFGQVKRNGWKLWILLLFVVVLVDVERNGVEKGFGENIFLVASAVTAKTAVLLHVAENALSLDSTVQAKMDARWVCNACEGGFAQGKEIFGNHNSAVALGADAILFARALETIRTRIDGDFGFKAVFGFARCGVNRGLKVLPLGQMQMSVAGLQGMFSRR